MRIRSDKVKVTGHRNKNIVGNTQNSYNPVTVFHNASILIHKASDKTGMSTKQLSWLLGGLIVVFVGVAVGVPLSLVLSFKKDAAITLSYPVRPL
jgi:cobalamin biosynthesis protein CobD/CbiB